MDIEGTYTLQAPAEDVRNCLLDAQTLQRSLPLVEQLEFLGGGKYSVALNIEHGPLVGRYQGHIMVMELGNPYHFHFTFEGEGLQSKISSDWTIVLDGYEQHTVVAYEASVSLGKPARSMPAPLVKGAIKLLIQEFFASLAQQLPTMPKKSPGLPAHAVVAEDDDEFFEADQPHPSIVVSSAAGQPTLAHTIVRRLHLGAGDVRTEERWVRRIRRFSITSILLLLVWIGTRLPRK